MIFEIDKQKANKQMNKQNKTKQNKSMRLDFIRFYLLNESITNDVKKRLTKSSMKPEIINKASMSGVLSMR